jgi:hypothetical protein
MLIHFLFGTAQVPDHRRPRFSTIMSAIDPHAVHSAREKISNQFVVGRGLRGHRHHDPDIASGGSRAKQDFSVFFQEEAAVPEPGDAVRPLCGYFLGTSEPPQQVHDGMQRTHDVRLRAPQRRKAKRRQLGL